MEGLIPYLIHAIKNKQQKSHGHGYRRSFSHSDSASNRSYHLLLGNSDSFSGSSHRRTRSDFQPPTVEFLEQRGYGVDGNFKVSPRGPVSVSAASASASTANATLSSSSAQSSRNFNNIRK